MMKPRIPSFRWRGSPSVHRSLKGEGGRSVPSEGGLATITNHPEEAKAFRDPRIQDSELGS